MLHTPIRLQQDPEPGAFVPCTAPRSPQAADAARPTSARPDARRRACSTRPKDRYAVQDTIQDSIFGRVFSARDTSDAGRLVCVKLSNLQLVRKGTSSAGVAVAEDPRAEARVMSLMEDCPNSVHLVAEHEQKGVLHWLVMEYVSGGDMFDYVSRKGMLAASEARFFFSQIASAVNHLHHHGYAHMDVSLENVMVDASGNALLCDYGAALDANAGPRTFDGPRPGKLAYMSPEVLAGKKPVADLTKCDAWSLGVVLFCLLTGGPPFEYASRRDPRFACVAGGQLDELISQLDLQDCFDEDSFDLMSQLLDVDPSRRPALKEILAHPFLAASSTRSA